MIDTKPTLLIAESRDFCPAALTHLQNHFDVEMADLDRARLLQVIGDCQYLWVRLRTMIDAEIIDAAKNLKAIVTNTTGLNHIDLERARHRGIQVFSLQGEADFLKTIRATAEHTLGLTLALLRKIPAAHQHARQGEWDRSVFSGREIYQKTVGIIGYGRLGKIVAGYFHAMDANVVVNDRTLAAGTLVDRFPCLSLSDLLSRADIVSLHVSYDRANRQMISEAQFRGMKRGAIFVNTARGELVDETALLHALESGDLAGAALDVVDSEHAPSPTRENLSRFARQSDRLILTPHIGGNTLESTQRTEIFLAEKLCKQSLAEATRTASV